MTLLLNQSEVFFYFIASSAKDQWNTFDRLFLTHNTAFETCARHFYIASNKKNYVKIIYITLIKKFCIVMMMLLLRINNWFFSSLYRFNYRISIKICSENLFRTMTDLVVSEGYAAAGYEYINVDDCWLEKNRGSRGELVADRRRFPSGMKSLATYVIKNAVVIQFWV